MTAAEILARCRDERRRCEALPLCDDGPIADSYDTLHSVRLIGLILDGIPETMPGVSRVDYLFFVAARLIDANLAELCEVAGHDARDGRDEEAANGLLWIERLLRLKQGIALFRPPTPAGKSSATGLAASPFPTALEALSETLLAHVERSCFPPIEAAASLGTAGASIVQRTKNILLLAREDALHPPLPVGIAQDIVAAHLECVAVAAQGMAMPRATRINQFCLLHQLPELIVPTVLRLWTSIEAGLAGDDPLAALDDARLAGDLLSIMLLSIEPLAEILYPSEYFRFRGNLGATSGSSSAALRGKLLTSAYIRLAERAVAAELERAASDPAHRRLLDQLARNRSLLYRWRAQHMALPRNLLGTGGTKSLMGSPDALKAVRSMADAFASKDPLSALFGPIDEGLVVAGSAVARLDDALLAETGRVARAAFGDVQERLGPWSKSTT